MASDTWTGIRNGNAPGTGTETGTRLAGVGDAPGAATAAAKIRWPHVVALVVSIFSFAVLATVANSAFGQAALVTPKPIERVASSEAGVVTIDEHELRIFDADGYPKQQRSMSVEPPVRSRRAAVADGFAPVPGLTADSDWTDPIDPDDLDDPDDPRLADETNVLPSDLDEAGPRSKSISLSVPRQREVLAVVGPVAWIGRFDGLWRVDLDDGLAQRVLPEREIRAVAAAAGHAGHIVAVAGGGVLSRSRDGGDTFEFITHLESAPRALAVSPDGTVYIIDNDGLRVSPPRGSGLEPLALTHVTDVASCGKDGIALTETGLFSIVGGTGGWRVQRFGVAPRGSWRIVCRSDSPFLIAYGDGLWTSEDRGQSWQTRTDLPPAHIASVSMSGTAIWVATASGLWRLPLRVTEIEGASEPRRLGVRSVTDPSKRPRPWWAAVLPRVDVSLTAAHATTRQDLRALIVLTFFLDRPPYVGWGHAAGADDLSHGRQVTDAALFALGQTLKGSSGDNSVTAEERKTLAQVLEDQP